MLGWLSEWVCPTLAYGTGVAQIAFGIGVAEMAFGTGLNKTALGTGMNRMAFGTGVAQMVGLAWLLLRAQILGGA